MKTRHVATPLLACALLGAAAAHAQLIPFYNAPPSVVSAKSPAPDSHHRAQRPIMADQPGIQLPTPPSYNDKSPKEPPPPRGDVILSDVLGTQKLINVFAGFTRDINTVSSRLDDSALNTTVLAPTNSAVAALPRKPWEDPKDYAELGTNAYEGRGGEDRAYRNLRRFTEAHIVDASPWNEGEKVKTLAGGEVWWEKRGQGSVVMPGEVEVERIVSRVANGEVWVLRGCLDYER